MRSVAILLLLSMLCVWGCGDTPKGAVKQTASKGEWATNQEP